MERDPMNIPENLGVHPPRPSMSSEEFEEPRTPVEMDISSMNVEEYDDATRPALVEARHPRRRPSMDVLALETGEIELDGIGSDPRTMKERRRSSIRVSSAITGAEDQEDQEVQEGTDDLDVSSGSARPSGTGSGAPPTPDMVMVGVADMATPVATPQAEPVEDEDFFNGQSTIVGESGTRFEVTSPASTRSNNPQHSVSGEPSPQVNMQIGRGQTPMQDPKGNFAEQMAAARNTPAGSVPVSAPKQNEWQTPGLQNWQQSNFAGVPEGPGKMRYNADQVPLTERERDRQRKFSQYRELNKHIRYLSRTSRRSNLVILNLPDPNDEEQHNVESAVDYMQFVQILTEGCPRVMLVHGTNHEVISGFNAVVDNLEASDITEEDPPVAPQIISQGEGEAVSPGGVRPYSPVSDKVVPEIY